MSAAHGLYDYHQPPKENTKQLPQPGSLKLC